MVNSHPYTAISTYSAFIFWLSFVSYGGWKSIRKIGSYLSGGRFCWWTGSRIWWALIMRICWYAALTRISGYRLERIWDRLMIWKTSSEIWKLMKEFTRTIGCEGWISALVLAPSATKKWDSWWNYSPLPLRSYYYP